MRLLACLAAVAAFGQAPSPTVFEIEMWPGEGRPQFQTVTNEIVIRESPALEAAITRRLPVLKGQPVAFDETRFRTIEPGQIEVLSAANVTGRVLGTTRLLTRESYYKGKFPRETMTVKPGDVIEYLQYRAEGTCFVRVAGQIVDAKPCPVHDKSGFRVINQPKTEWWIRVVVDRVPVGWVMVNEKTVKESGPRSG